MTSVVSSPLATLVERFGRPCRRVVTRSGHGKQLTGALAATVTPGSAGVGVRLLGQTEQPLADDGALDLVAAARDSEPGSAQDVGAPVVGAGLVDLGGQVRAG